MVQVTFRNIVQCETIMRLHQVAHTMSGVAMCHIATPDRCKAKVIQQNLNYHTLSIISARFGLLRPRFSIDRQILTLE